MRQGFIDTFRFVGCHGSYLEFLKGITLTRAVTITLNGLHARFKVHPLKQELVKDY